MKHFYITETLPIEGCGEEVEVELETEIEVDYSIEPGQKGGHTDPSWAPRVHIEGAVRAQDLRIKGFRVAAAGDAITVPERDRPRIEQEIIEYLGEP